MSDAAGSAAPENTAAGSGGRLRAERERRGLSLQKVAEDLHLDQWVIEALEAGKLASLGAPVYAHGHMRKYALLLGLDGNELLAACEERVEVPELRPLRAKQLPNRRKLPWRRIAMAILIVVAVAALGWWGYPEWQRAHTQGSQQSLPPVATPIPQPAAAMEPAGDSSSSIAADAAPAANDAAPMAGGTVRLKMSFRADSWTEVFDAGGKRLLFDLGLANSARSLTGNAPLRVFLGYADGVQLEVNGRPVPLPASLKSGNLAHFSIDAQGQLHAAADEH